MCGVLGLCGSTTPHRACGPRTLLLLTVGLCGGTHSGGVELKGIHAVISVSVIMVVEETMAMMMMPCSVYLQLIVQPMINYQ